MIKRNYYKVVRVFPDPSSYFYIKNESMNRGQITFKSSWLNTVNLEYSFDKVNWSLISSSNTWIDNVPADSYVYFRNTSGTFCTSEYDNVLTPFFKLSIGGDVRTLFNYTDVDSVTAIPDYGFNNPIGNGIGNGSGSVGSTEIIDISNLSFRGITSIGNYGLYSAFMFKDTFTKGVDLRDVTTLGEGALNEMYYHCHNLTEAYAPNVSTWDTNKSQSWLDDVAPTGVVYKPSTLTIPQGDSSDIPSGWTTQDYPTI